MSCAPTSSSPSFQTVNCSSDEYFEVAQSESRGATGLPVDLQLQFDSQTLSPDEIHNMNLIFGPPTSALEIPDFGNSVSSFDNHRNVDSSVDSTCSFTLEFDGDAMAQATVLEKGLNAVASSLADPAPLSVGAMGEMSEEELEDVQLYSRIIQGQSLDGSIALAESNIGQFESSGAHVVSPPALAMTGDASYASLGLENPMPQGLDAPVAVPSLWPQSGRDSTSLLSDIAGHQNTHSPVRLSTPGENIGPVVPDAHLSSNARSKRKAVEDRFESEDRRPLKKARQNDSQISANQLPSYPPSNDVYVMNSRMVALSQLYGGPDNVPLHYRWVMDGDKWLGWIVPGGHPDLLRIEHVRREWIRREIWPVSIAQPSPPMETPTTLLPQLLPAQSLSQHDPLPKQAPPPATKGKKPQKKGKKQSAKEDMQEPGFQICFEEPAMADSKKAALQAARERGEVVKGRRPKNWVPVKPSVPVASSSGTRAANAANTPSPAATGSAQPGNPLYPSPDHADHLREQFTPSPELAFLQSESFIMHQNSQRFQQ